MDARKMLQVSKNIFALTVADALRYRDELERADAVDDAPDLPGPEPRTAEGTSTPAIVAEDASMGADHEPRPLAPPASLRDRGDAGIERAASAPEPAAPVKIKSHVTALTIGVFLIVAVAMALVAVVSVWTFTSSLPSSQTDEVLSVGRSFTLPLRAGG